MKLFIKKINEDAIMPVKATDGAAAFDVFIPQDVFIPAYQRTIVSTGLAMEIEKGYEVKIEPRSGFSSKGMEGYRFVVDAENNVVIADKSSRYEADVLIGKIDSDYRGCIGVIIANHDEAFVLRKGTRIAQMTVYSLPDVEMEEKNELSVTERGEGGFGHTGSM